MFESFIFTLCLSCKDIDKYSERIMEQKKQSFTFMTLYGSRMADTAALSKEGHGAPAVSYCKGAQLQRTTLTKGIPFWVGCI